MSDDEDEFGSVGGGGRLNLDDSSVDMSASDPSDHLLGVGIVKPPRNTSKQPIPESCMLKRSTLGRAELFLPGFANYSDVRCSSSITQHVQRNALFHPHKQNNRTPDSFQKPCDLACWHCCHSFSPQPPVPVPKDFDASEGAYIVYGCFCSLSCAKSHLLETHTFNSGYQVMLLSKMAKECYDCDNIVAAPPRLALDLFGGPFSIEQFRAQHNEVVIHDAPFVSTYMVVEERQATHDVVAMGVDSGSSVRGLRRPQSGGSASRPAGPPSGTAYFAEFVKEKGGAGGGGSANVALTAPPPASTATARRSSTSSVSGNLSQLLMAS